jgi:hypothetical protein
MADIPANIEANVQIKKFEIDPSVQKQLDEMISIGIAGSPGGGEAAKELPAAIGANTESQQDMTKVIKEFVKNSRVYNTLMGTLGKAMGLLVDVILLPFVPLFVWVLVGIFKIIMLFYKIWKELWDGKGIQTIAEWLKKVAKYIADGIGGLFKLGIEFLTDVADKIFQFLIWVWENGKLALEFVVAAVTGFLKWLWDTFSEAGKAVSLAIGFIVDTISDFLGWLWDVAMGIGNFITMNINDGSIGEWIKKIIDFAGKVLTITVDFVEAGSNAAVSAFQSGVSAVTKFVSGVASFIHLAKGGTVTQTGSAVVHKGETIIPAGKGGVTVNITGQFKSDEEMYRRFIDRLRQEQWRTNV